MKTISIFVLGIILGIVVGLGIVVTTPIGHRYQFMEYSYIVNFRPTSFLIKYDTWSGRASVLSFKNVKDKYDTSSQTGVWAPLP